MDERQDKGFVVVDRRRFDETGEARPDPPAEPEPPPATPNEATPQPQSRSLEPMDFATFVISLSSSAFFYLGDAPNPKTGKTERDLPLARQTIDLLALLQEKTRGNLTEDESHVLQGLLTELRMRYVQEWGQAPPRQVSNSTRENDPNVTR